ncbi:MAG: NAD-dependent epimerase/dehydratase family protein, partial [Balneolaceae bacterium]
MKVLITGTAGFIGFHLAKKLLSNGFEVLGLDNVNDYYDTRLKKDRLADCGIKNIKDGKIVVSQIYSNYRFIKADIEDKVQINSLFEKENFDIVINLAAQAGVRYSLENPQVYLDTNVTGFLNILEGCRNYPVKHLIYASSSSVYGSNKKMPFKTSDVVDHPVSLYATSKKTNELMAHTYSHLFNIPTTGLRFFTVYGPWGRPDMALFLFTKAMIEGNSIDVYNYGKMARDFTYIDDIVDG